MQRFADNSNKINPKIGDSQMFYQAILLLNTIGFAEEE